MIISKRSITSTTKLNIGYDLKDWVKPFTYPISNIDSLSVTGYFIKDKNNDIECSLHIKGSIQVRDSRDDVPFDKFINISESFLLFEEDDGEKEGYVFSEDEINLNELVVKLIISSLPFQLYREEKISSKEGKGYRVMKEEDVKGEEKYNPAFDALKNLDL